MVIIVKHDGFVKLSSLNSIQPAKQGHDHQAEPNAHLHLTLFVSGCDSSSFTDSQLALLGHTAPGVKSVSTILASVHFDLESGSKY